MYCKIDFEPLPSRKRVIQSDFSVTCLAKLTLLIREPRTIFLDREGKLIGAAILKATQQGRLAEEDRMRQLMFDAAPRTMAEGESRFKG